MAVKLKSPASVKFKTTILKFNKKGEKTGWTYIEIPIDVTSKIFPGNKKSFRVKGFLDDKAIKGIALLPMGNGNFIMPLNAALRKLIGKKDGAMLSVNIEADKKELQLNKDLMICLNDEPKALLFFKSLSRSHQNYFSKWIDSAKTPETKARRIAKTLIALSGNMHYGQMLQAEKKLNT
jgi:hypothetical protein